MKLYHALSSALCVSQVVAFGGVQETQAGSSSRRAEPREAHTSTEWQIWAYSTAAPDRLGSGATIMDGTMAVLKEGTNGWSCMPANPRGMKDPAKGWADPHEAMPVCFDSAGMQWMQGWMAGTAPKLDRDALVYMLHGDMGEDNTTPGVMTKEEASDPANWIESGPHLMLMPKTASDMDAYPSDFNAGGPYAMFKGNKFAHLMIPVDGYYDYQDGPSKPPKEPRGPHTSDEWQIWAYSTAAPYTKLGSEATIMDGNMKVLKEGTNGWSCMPANPRGMANPEQGWKNPKEAMPACFDSAGMDWMQGWMADKTPQMKRSAIIYMNHGDQGEDNMTPRVMTKEEAANPDDWIVSGPHIMLMPEKASDLDGFSTDFSTGAPFVMFKGTPFAHVMAPLPGFYD